MPSASFLLLGLWWTFNIWRRYFRAVQNRRLFHANVSFPLRQSSHVPWESLLVIFCTGVAIIGELVTGRTGDKRVVYIENEHHVTMYVMFALASGTEAARVKGYELVPGLEYVTWVMAFVSEGLLFAFHGHGDSDMEMLVHHLLLYVVLANAVALAAEGFWRHSVLVALIRAFFALLQGTWLVQIGLILYPQQGWPGRDWDVNSARQMKLATVVFVLHWIGVLVAMVTIGVFLRWKSGIGLRSCTPVKNGQCSGQDAAKLLVGSEDEM